MPASVSPGQTHCSSTVSGGLNFWFVGKPETIHFNGCPTSRRLVACSSRGLLAATLALLSGGFQLAVAFCVDLLLTPREHVLRRLPDLWRIQVNIKLASTSANRW